jgi:hypothetical protein
MARPQTKRPTHPKNKTYILGIYHGMTNKVEEWEVKGHNVVYVLDGGEDVFVTVINTNKQTVFSVNAARLSYVYLKGTSVITKRAEETKHVNKVAGIRAVSANEQ